MLKGRLGLETARVPHKDRHGAMWLGRGKLYVDDGCLTFATAGWERLDEGCYDIPFQGLTTILIGPGTTVSHDALRLMARHGTGLVAVGEDGVRFYSSMPFGPDDSRRARRHALLWANENSRVDVAKQMYQVRMGLLLPQRDLDALRGVEGHRVKELYKQLAYQYGIEWGGRRYDRQNPEATNDVNQAINHAATAIGAAAMIAVT
ncbi:MAG: type I-E CRISPR-associated endonuclease Cas1, partial [Myxococcota bacterium]